MGKFYKVIVVAAIIIVSVFSVYAVELSESDAIKLAIENNLTLKSSYVDVQTADRLAKNSWNNLFPDIGIGADLESQNAYNFFKTMQFEGNVYGNITFNPSMISEIQTAKQNYQNGLLSYSDAVAKITVNVRKLYYNIVLQDLSINIRESILSAQYDRMVRAERNAQNGVESQLEALQTRVTYENNKPAVQEAKVAVKASRRALAILLGIDTEQDIILTDTINTKEYNIDINAVLSGIPDRFDIRINEGNIKLTELKKNTMKLSVVVPTISVTQSWIPYINDVTKKWKNKDNYSDSGLFDLAVSWNISNILPWSKKQQAVKNLEDQNVKNRINKQLLTDSAQAEIKTLVATIEQNLETIKASDTTVELARRSYEMVKEQYRLGLKDELEMRDSENQLRTAELNRLNGQYNYIAAIIDLEYASQTTIIN